MFYELIYGTLSTVFSTFLIILLQNLAEKRISIKEKEEVKKSVNDTIEKIKDSETVIDLMKNNLGELREYYVISKQQANKAFSSALLISILGFIVFTSGIFISYFSEKSIIAFTTIAGSIVEVISCLFFSLYKSSLTQLNIYHERLGSTEKYLTAMQLIEKMSEDKKDENYKFLMESILIDNRSILQNKIIDQTNNTNSQNKL